MKTEFIHQAEKELIRLEDEHGRQVEKDKRKLYYELSDDISDYISEFENKYPGLTSEEFDAIVIEVIKEKFLEGDVKNEKRK